MKIKWKIPKIVKPKGTSWTSADRYNATFYLAKVPLSGGHLVFATVGRKWVKISKGDLLFKGLRSKTSRFRLSLKEWQNCNPTLLGAK